VLDRERILAKIDALHGYERELRVVLPDKLEEYISSIEKRRATERLLQVSIECVLDICNLFVAGLRLGLPTEEENLFDRLERAQIISPERVRTLRSMRRFRNILVHEYGGIDDQIVFGLAARMREDVETLITEVTRALAGVPSGS
jgi:uncharacterized protein YutE (UPF0331/DUF86 family)